MHSCCAKRQSLRALLHIGQLRYSNLTCNQLLSPGEDVSSLASAGLASSLAQRPCLPQLQCCGTASTPGAIANNRRCCRCAGRLPTASFGAGLGVAWRGAASPNCRCNLGALPALHPSLRARGRTAKFELGCCNVGLRRSRLTQPRRFTSSQAPGCRNALAGREPAGGSEGATAAARRSAEAGGRWVRAIHGGVGHPAIASRARRPRR